MKVKIEEDIIIKASAILDALDLMLLNREKYNDSFTTLFYMLKDEIEKIDQNKVDSEKKN